MADEDERTGGLAAWGPRAVPGPGVDLTPAQELAIALRHLDDVGWCENLTGHITVQQGDDFLVNPWGLWWGEVRARDLLTIDADGTVSTASGTSPLRSTSTPSCTVAAPTPPSSCTTTRRTRRRSPPIGELPDLVHQNSSILADELVLVTDYDGEVDQPTLGAELAERIGDASVALLVSHGVIVTAPTIEEAVYKSVLFERTCMLHWLVRAMDRTPDPDRTDAPEAAQGVAGRARRAGVLARCRAHARARRARGVGVAMAIPLEELQAKQGFTTATAGRSRWLPEPERADRRFTMISVDDHIVEPPRRVRGPAPGEVRRARAAGRRTRRRQRGVGVRGSGAAERRVQRGRRAGR